MDGEKTTTRRGVGRPARYVDQADRQAAYRERQELAALKGQAAAALTDRPTPAFVRTMIGRLLDQAADREATRAELVAYLAGAGSAPTSTT